MPSACQPNKNELVGVACAYTCAADAPWRDATDPLLSYGYAAVPDKRACGACFEFEFSGSGYYDATHVQPGQPGQPPPDETRDVGSMRLLGKRMIVQVMASDDLSHGPSHGLSHRSHGL